MTLRAPDKPVLKRGLSRHEAADYIGIGATLFDALVRNNLMPKPKAIFARRVWDIQELDRAFHELPEADDPAHANDAGGGKDPYDNLHV
jgi:hypothetical protein